MLFHKHKEAKVRAEQHAHDVAELREKVEQLTDSEDVVRSGCLGDQRFRGSAQNLKIEGVAYRGA